MSTISTETIDVGPVPKQWTRRHLLGLEELSAEEITLLWQYLHGRIARVPGRLAAQQAAAGTQARPAPEPGRQEIA